MFQNKSVLPLFPCNVWVHELAPEVYEPMNAKLLARIEELLTPRPAIQPGFTWQTRNDLHRKRLARVLVEIGVYDHVVLAMEGKDHRWHGVLLPPIVPPARSR